MASKSQTDDLMERLHANGLRKRVARDLSTAIAAAGSSGPSKAAQMKIADLLSAESVIEDRAKGGPAKRSATAKKAAATRKRKAAQRSATAKKAARTRAKAKA